MTNATPKEVATKIMTMANEGKVITYVFGPTTITGYENFQQGLAEIEVLSGDAVEVFKELLVQVGQRVVF